MAYFAKTQIQHGLDDGTAVTIQPGDEITAEHGLNDNDIATLLASDSIEESDEFSGETPVGPLQRVTVAEGVEGSSLPSGAPEPVDEEDVNAEESVPPAEVVDERTPEEKAVDEDADTQE